MARHHSTKRPPALSQADYDHEILLLDHTSPPPPRDSPSPALTRNRSQSESDGEQFRPHDSLAPILTADDNVSRRHSADLSRKSTQASTALHKQLTRRKYGKWTHEDPDHPDPSKRRRGSVVSKQPVAIAAPVPVPRGGNNEDETESHRLASAASRRSNVNEQTQSPDRDTAIDILYENQRGGILCGMYLFSSKALGAADSPPWVNSAFKASATDIENAQVPDPSWMWQSKEWVVNHQDNLDKDGWEYSFMYAKWCSWHMPHWYNSFVRRRAWIRQRVKKRPRMEMEAHRLNSDYFTIHPQATRNRSRSRSRTRSLTRVVSTVSSRFSMSRSIEADVPPEDIEDIGSLMSALKESRIDREKTEAVENFIIHGGEDLVYLSEKMDEIMHQFIFQASRRSLFAHLSRLFEQESAAASELPGGSSDKRATDSLDDRDSDLPDGLLHVPIDGKPKADDKAQSAAAAAQRRLKNIEAAYRSADAAVKSLEYWSDIKDLTATGAVKNAVAESEGWDGKWMGLDPAAPRDVLTDPVVGEDLDLGIGKSREGYKGEDEAKIGRGEKAGDISGKDAADDETEGGWKSKSKGKEKQVQDSLG